MELHGSSFGLTSRAQPNGQPGNTGAGAGYTQSPPATQQFQPSATTWQPQLSYGSQSGIYLPSNTGSLPLSPSAIYDAALRVSSPRVSDDDSGLNPSTGERRVVRQVEVPFTRSVKVPVTTRQFVPVTVEKKIKSTRLVEVPSTREVTEVYDEVIQKPTVRNKEIWVKKVVQERVMEPVVVKRTRKVTVPSTEVREIPGYEVVQTTEQRAVDVPGWRVDEVVDSKLYETEEIQQGMNPYAPNRSTVVAAREIGPIRGFHHSRKVGTAVFHPNDAAVAGLEEDVQPAGPFSQTARSMTGGPSRSAVNRRFYAHGPAFNQTGSASARSTMSNTGAADTASLGFRVRNGEANGIVVYSVAPGEAAERAGLRTGDVLCYVNNRPSRTVSEARAVISNSSGPLLLKVRRRGVNSLMLVLHR